MTESGFFEWLESSAAGDFMRGSPVVFPIVEIMHIAGFVALVGSAFLFDLRLLGFSKHLSVKALAAYLLSKARWSLLLVVPSGLLLFISQASALSVNYIFQIKLILIGLAFANAAVFHIGTAKSIANWDTNSPSPTAARVAAIISITLWTAVLSCGRFIAYL